MPYNGNHAYVSQEAWDAFPDEVKETVMTCNMPVGGPYARPGRINALDDQGQPGFSSRSLGWENDEVGTEVKWDVSDDVAYFGAIWSPYKMWKISEDIVMLKIINFGYFSDPKIERERRCILMSDLESLFESRPLLNGD